MVDMVAEPVCFKFIINTKKNKTFQMEWYVYYHDSNTQKIIKWNVFNHGTFAEKVNKLLQENLSRDEFADGLKKYLMYYFWSKCEYEIILSPWTGQADDIKIDVYDQIRMNFDRFVDYVWSLKEIKKGAE